MGRWLSVAEAALDRGGPVLWLIAAMSVLTAALILWRFWRLVWMGAWGGTDLRPAVAAWTAGDLAGAEALLRGSRGMRARTAAVAMALRRDPHLSDAAAREEITRLALGELRDARAGLRTLDLVAATAPLLGLLGTVLGMIDAFQAMEGAGASTDPSILAGGIWEALLTTAAGMAVAIPATMASAWFDGVVERIGAEMEDVVTRIFTRGPPQGGR